MIHYGLLSLLVACTVGDRDDTGDSVGEPDPRQALRDVSLAANGSFEEESHDGILLDWVCSCPTDDGWTHRDCAVGEEHTWHGERALVIAPGCSVHQDLHVEEPTIPVRFDLYVRAQALDLLDPMWFLLWQFDETGGSLGFVGAEELEPLEDGWGLVSRGSTELDEVAVLRATFYNGSEEDLILDDFVLVGSE